MISVTVIYESSHKTWNIMTLDNECLHYGTAESVDKWLDDNTTTHIEVYL